MSTIVVHASSGAVKYVGGTIREVTGKDISGATFAVSMGSYNDPGSTWWAPDVSEQGASLAERVVKLRVSSSVPSGLVIPGTYWCWVRITDAPEIEPLRVQGPIEVR